MIDTTYILPATYFGNILNYALLVNHHTITEQYANYVKQTYSNRTTILTSQGIYDLTIPIEKPQEKTIIRDIHIANNNNWAQQHWRSIESAYSSSAYFEYFRDDIELLYQKKWKFLLDFDLKTQETVLNILNYTNINNNLSDSYISNCKINIIDCRELINPKKFDVSLHNELKEPYYQQFFSKFGFIANLSILDLLFNMGNESRIYLKQLQNIQLNN